MKRLFLILLLCLIPAVSYAQDKNAPKEAAKDNQKGAPVSFDLDEEKLTIEADIPSVDLIISFREIQERNSSMKSSFLDEIIESAKDEPF